MAQLIFQWPPKPSYASEDFILSPANSAAADFLDTWPQPAAAPSALLSGAASSGKTHLVHRWTTRTGATLLDATKLGSVSSAQLWGDTNCAVLENIHTMSDEAALFHLLRHTESNGLALLLTSRLRAGDLPFTLADLRSRLLALPAAHIDPPDETLLHAFLIKSFADRQLVVTEEILAYMVRRMERSFATAQEMVAAVERRAFETKREITIPLIKPLFAA